MTANPSSLLDVSSLICLCRVSEFSLKICKVRHENLFFRGSLTTGHNPANALFIYNGDGAYGINSGEIGIHENLLKADFEEAVSMFFHEVGHNASMSHGHQFIVVTDALSSERENTLGDIARTSENNRNQWQRRILEIELEWNELRGVE